jgi:hypothetical protein
VTDTSARTLYSLTRDWYECSYPVQSDTWLIRMLVPCTVWHVTDTSARTLYSQTRDWYECSYPVQSDTWLIRVLVPCTVWHVTVRDFTVPDLMTSHYKYLYCTRIGTRTGYEHRYDNLRTSEGPDLRFEILFLRRKSTSTEHEWGGKNDKQTLYLTTSTCVYT